MCTVERHRVHSFKRDKLTKTMFSFARDFDNTKDAWAHAYMMRKRGYDDSGVQNTLWLFVWSAEHRFCMTADHRMSYTRPQTPGYDDHNEKLRRADYVQQTYLTPYSYDT
jgi:hypothetical protein